MPPIPDTGGGLSGFLAHGLWHVYRHFPSRGEHDWLLLFVVLGLGVHAAFLPYLWKAVKKDMTSLKEGQGYMAWGSMPVFLTMGTMVFFLWFFHTTAGRTFLEGRGSLSEVNRGLFWFVLVADFILLGTAVNFANSLDEANQYTRSQPYPDRGFRELYAGGGVFVSGKDGSKEPWPLRSVIILESFVVGDLLIFYWYWSVASIALMLCFLVPGVAFEACRVLFVYILHKKTFG